MTELEALETVLAAAQIGLESGLIQAQASVFEAIKHVEALIEQVKSCEENPDTATALAEKVMQEQGMYITATFSREWFDGLVTETALRPLTEVETESLLSHLIGNSVENATEQTYDEMCDWLATHIKLEEQANAA